MKQRKHLVLASVILFTLVAIFAAKHFRIFDTFNKNTLIQSTFGADLTPYIPKPGTASISAGSGKASTATIQL